MKHSLLVLALLALAGCANTHPPCFTAVGPEVIRDGVTILPAHKTHVCPAYVDIDKE